MTENDDVRHRAPEFLNAALGERMRELRNEARLRQEEVAAIARLHGLPTWRQATVGAYENGRRSFDFGTLVALHEVWAELLGRTVTFWELFPDTVPLPSGTMTRTELEHRLTSAFTPTWNDPFQVSISPVPSPNKNGLEDLEARIKEAVEILGPLWSHLGIEPDELRHSARSGLLDPGGPAEARLATKLGIQRWELMILSYVVWDSSLTVERDRRVDATASPEASKNQLRALRRSITLQLVEEANPWLQPLQATDEED